MTGSSSTPLKEKIAARLNASLDAQENVTQELLKEHEEYLQQRLSDAQRTTVRAISAHWDQLTATLSEAEKRQRSQLESIEQCLATAVTHAEKLSRFGGVRSWARPLVIILAVMLGVAAATKSGLLLSDRLIDSRIERLAMLRQEIRALENAPRLPEELEILEINGGLYLVGLDPSQHWQGRLRDGQPVIELTQTRE